MKASDFTRWAGPRAAHIETAVTVVTAVTAGHNPSVSKGFGSGGAVTTTSKTMVTAVTNGEPEASAVTVVTTPPQARLPETSFKNEGGNRGDQGNRAEENIEGALDQERAPIIECDAGVPSSWAEGFAGLDPERPPSGVPLMRWQQFIDDTGRFLDGGFAEKAVMLGWGAFDLFGCDRDRPFDRIDQQGLCWLIAGNRLVDLSENGAVIETWTGACQNWRRKPGTPGRVLAWELMP